MRRSSHGRTRGGSVHRIVHGGGGIDQEPVPGTWSWPGPLLAFGTRRPMHASIRRFLTLALGLVLSATAPAAGVLEEVGGPVDATPAGQERWRRMEAGDQLAAGEILRTGPNGYAVIRQGERVVEVSRGSLLRWESSDRLQVERGRVAVSQPGSAPRLEIRGASTQGSLRAGRLQLVARGGGDRWRALAGNLEVTPASGEGAVTIPEGRQVLAGPDGLGVVQDAPGPREERSPRRRRRPRLDRQDADQMLREDLRWRDTLEKLVTASRRLVRRAERDQISPQDQVFDQLEELGTALDTARARIESMSEERTLGTPAVSRSGVDLAAQAARAVETHRSLESRLGRLRRPGPLGGPGAVGVTEIDASPTGRPDSQVALARIEEATRFLHRYQQALRRFLRVLARLIQVPPASILPGQGPRIRGRIVGGYRQAERLVLQARSEVQRVPRQDRSPQVARRLQGLNRQWRVVGTQFRRGQELVRRLQARLASLGP